MLCKKSDILKHSQSSHIYLHTEAEKYRTQNQLDAVQANGIRLSDKPLIAN